MSAQPAAAEIIGNYMIERALAQGSMGHVYVARHQLTYARVALKVLRSELASDAHSEERFLREVRAAAQIGHDGIVKVLDAGCDQHGRLYLAMELLSGETLEERMARDPGDRLTLMRWILHALPPLAAAHAQGIIHRDLKPANLFIAALPDGQEMMKLLDFGLARDTRQKSRTETGIALGTPYYMSPEQAMRPKEVGPQTDVWAMGVMMYEVLSGSMPFDGETLHAVVLQSSTRPHVPLATRRPELDPALCELVEDCLCKDPALRPHDASALLSRLLPILEDPRICVELEHPTTTLRPGSERVSERSIRHSNDGISYADTAITLPAPRIDESDASYGQRRHSNPPVLVPIVLSILLLGAGTIGYLRFAPTWHLHDEQPAEVQKTSEVATPPPAALAQTTPLQPAAATAAVVAAPAQAQPEAAAAPSTAAAAAVVEEERATSPRDARAQSAKSKRAASRSRRATPELPLPPLSNDIPADAPSGVTNPGPEAAPAPDADWDKINAKLGAGAPVSPEPLLPDEPAAEPPKAEAPPPPPSSEAPRAAEPSADPSAEPRAAEASLELETLPPPEPEIH